MSGTARIMAWLAVIMMAASRQSVLAFSDAEARLALWKSNNAQPAATATLDGNRIVEINGSAALAAQAMAIPQADVDAAQAAAAVAAAYPSPDVTVPILDASGNPTGTARLLVDADGSVVAVVNSASPQRTWSEQRAAFAAARTNTLDIVEALKTLKVTMTNNIAAAQAIDPTAWTGAQRTQMQAVRKSLVDQAQAANALRRTLLRFYKVTE